MKKITLNMDGREMTFSEQELVAIVKKHFSYDTTQKVTTTKEEQNFNKAIHQTTTVKVAKKPTEGEWFEVKPQAIDQRLFEKKRKGNQQETTRQLILEAFKEMEYNPDQYGRNFKTLIPKKTWSLKTVIRLKKMARKKGNHMANWIEQALEWAQRIANGESWESVCNDADTANWYRLVEWKNGYVRRVGGSNCTGINFPASSVSSFDYDDSIYLGESVPLVVSYK